LAGHSDSMHHTLGRVPSSITVVDRKEAT
jgi:hypothetical protein